MTDAPEGLPGSLKAAVAAVLVALVAGVLLAGGGEEGSGLGGVLSGGGRTFGAAFADPVPYDGRSPALATGRRERVLVELPRPALAELDDVQDMAPRAQRRYVASLEQEARALLSALDARGVQTRRVVTYERAWHGFAATVDAKDLPGLQSLGVRLRANRRFYPAVSAPIDVGDPTGIVPPEDAPEVALLGGGARTGVEGGYDAVDRDEEPVPGGGETGGQPLADELARLGVRARVVRVSARRRVAGLAGPEEFGRTDELLEGLEHVVDPDFDGDTSDHDRVALVGVNAPYAGFAQSPEIQAVQGALELGTLVVAPAGHEGAGTPALGTIGSPGASPGALAVAPSSDPQAVARTRLTVGDVTVTGAAVLAGRPPPGELRTSAPVPDPAAEDAPAVQGRLAVVRAGANPGAQAAAAAAAGATAVLLAQPRADRPLPAMAAGRVDVPVLGVTGRAASAVLGLDAGASARAEGVRADRTGRPGRIGPFASRGPAFSGAAKPDLARLGTTIAGGRLVAGAGVAAAAVAVEAAKAGETDAAALRDQLLAASDLSPAPPGKAPAPPDVPVGTPEVRQGQGSTGVEFTVGTFDRGDPAAGRGTTIVPALVLELTLERDGVLVERLTPPDGERGVLPGEYAYTLPATVVRDLEPGRYTFRVRARAPRQQRATVAESPPFDVR